MKTARMIKTKTDIDLYAQIRKNPELREMQLLKRENDPKDPRSDRIAIQDQAYEVVKEERFLEKEEKAVMLRRAAKKVEFWCS